MTTAAPQAVNISTLPIHELKRVLDQVTQEVEMLSGSMQSLKSAQSQFVDSKKCLEIMKNAEKGKEMLVPLSSSLYVPGNLNDNENVLVDIGTGYYVEKNVQDAEEYFSRKTDYLKTQMEQLQRVLQQKYQSKQMVTEVLQTKILQQTQQTQS